MFKQMAYLANVLLLDDEANIGGQKVATVVVLHNMGDNLKKSIDFALEG